jgi:hypothetical protein
MLNGHPIDIVADDRDRNSEMAESLQGIPNVALGIDRLTIYV